MSMSSAMSSAVWEVFKVDERDKSKANCTLCGNQLTRGADARSRGTSNLRRHLQTAHLKKWTELDEKDKKQKDANCEFYKGFISVLMFS